VSRLERLRARLGKKGGGKKRAAHTHAAKGTLRRAVKGGRSKKVKKAGSHKR